MLTRIPLLLIVSLAAALITAGCGDDDEETTTTTTEATATGATGATGAGGSEFVQQADQICREGNKEINTEAQDFFGGSQQEPPPAEQEKFATDVLVPNIEQQIEDVSALTPPEGEEDLFDEFIDQARSDLDEAKSDPSLLLGQTGDDPFAETNELATELGLKVCSQG